MSTIFTKIINREIPGQFIYEDDVCVAIMDKFPVTEGQCMVIPKKEVAYVFDLDDETYNHIFMIAKKICLALDTALDTQRTCLAIEGFEVPHVHIKLLPISKTAENLTSLESLIGDRKEQSDESLKLIAEKIKALL